jgi:hypothetical protein
MQVIIGENILTDYDVMSDFDIMQTATRKYY